MTPMQQLKSQRDYAAWLSAFTDINRLEAGLATLRARIVAELGWEVVLVTDLRPGDSVKAGNGWYTVDHVEDHTTNFDLIDDDRPHLVPHYLVVFEDAEGTYEVEANWPGNPIAPLVTRAWDESREPF